MDNTAYKQEFLAHALTYKELVNVPFTDSPIENQTIVGVKYDTIDYLGRIDADGTFIVREDIIAVLTENGYNPEDSVVIDISLGYDETCTCDLTDCHNIYSSFSCKETDASSCLKDLVQNISNSESSTESLATIVDDWLLTPLLTNTHINAKTVFIAIPEFADESHYTSVIKI